MIAKAMRAKLTQVTDAPYHTADLTIAMTHHVSHHQAGFDLSVHTTLPLSKGNIGIFGASGAGKSTLLRCMAGLIPAKPSDHHSVVMLGKEISTQRVEQNPFVYQFQQGMLFPHLSVQQNLTLVANQPNVYKPLPYSLDQVVAWCQIETLLTKNATVLSGGEAQRVAFARTLLSGKPIMLLDEPFSALDWHSRQHYLALIRWLSTQYRLRFILVSHILQDLAACTQSTLQLDAGALVRLDDTAEIVRTLSMHRSASHTQGTGDKSVIKYDAFSVLHGRVKQHLPQYGLTEVQLMAPSQQSLFIHTQEFAHGVDVAEEAIVEEAIVEEAMVEETVAKKVMAKDIIIVQLPANKVSLAKQAPNTSSILNCLTGVITSIELDAHHATVQVNVDQQAVLAEISLMSAESLALSVGDIIYLQFKAI
ncbi:ATP-binding cassette domain-containing protein [Flocculibacter collagenilyticus]|uniref:ATP-binding cassette domain-containing protein n=1 Tax=Flocculibacter collagenilyticus TaxID=2744479 RepID=UPI0018F35C74|nr:ATP-binding cassette domain-containing protein [Flocculibacter collagenilyticus]